MATKKEKTSAEAIDSAEEQDHVTTPGEQEGSTQEPGQDDRKPEESTEEQASPETAEFFV